MTHITVVTPNPAIDVTYELTTFVEGATNRVVRVHRTPGGKGLNVARVLEKLGQSSVSVGPVGGRSGKWIRDEVESRGLRAIFTDVAAESRSTVTVAITKEGAVGGVAADGRAGDAAHPTVLAEPGAALSDDDWDRLTDAISLTHAGCTMLVIAGSFPPDTDLRILGRWVADAHAAGIPSLVDSSGPALVAAARAGADIVKPNNDELLASTGEATTERGMKRLLELGARIVVVSLGVHGLIASDGTATCEMPAVARRGGNPTGAGDAATAGLVAALAQGLTIENALRWAAAAGAAAVVQPTAGDIDVADFSSLIERSTKESA